MEILRTVPGSSYGDGPGDDEKNRGDEELNLRGLLFPGDDIFWLVCDGEEERQVCLLLI